MADQNGMSRVVGTKPVAATFAPEHIGALAEASRRAKKIRRCVTVATFGGWTTGVFGGFSALGLVLSFSFAGLFISAALLGAAWGEFHGAAMVKRFDPRGARRLAINQIGLGSALVVYAVWCLITGLTGKSALAASGSPEVDAMVAGLEKTITLVLYGSLAIVGVIGPGLTAWYYESRGRLIREFRKRTDPSVLEALKAA